MALENFEHEIRYLVESENLSCKEVQTVLRSRYGLSRGTSERNIYNFCKDNNIHRYDYSVLGTNGIDVATHEALHASGPTYGRKITTGLLRSSGLRIGEGSVGQSLVRVNPSYAADRQAGRERCMNPSPYYAQYAGHKFHMDQNEKLVMYGVTHVIAVDGFSSKVLAHATMPVKNNLLIYDHVFRKAVLEFGSFDQFRVDCGKEFYVCMYQQDNLFHYRTNVSRPSYIQYVSKQNHRVERLWVEVNARVNCPVKCAIKSMIDDDLIDMRNKHVKFCVSHFASEICNINLRVAVAAWNNHPIPGKGVPDILFRDNCFTVVVPNHFLPSAQNWLGSITGMGDVSLMKPLLVWILLMAIQSYNNIEKNV